MDETGLPSSRLLHLSRSRHRTSCRVSIAHTVEALHLLSLVQTLQLRHHPPATSVHAAQDMRPHRDGDGARAGLHLGNKVALHDTHPRELPVWRQLDRLPNNVSAGCQAARQHREIVRFRNTRSGFSFLLHSSCPFGGGLAALATMNSLRSSSKRIATSLLC